MSAYDLDAINALVIRVAIDLAYRAIRSKYRQTPLSVAPAPSRFSDPEGHYTVLYGTTSPSCSLWEAVFRGRFDRVKRRRFSRSELEDYLLVTLTSREVLSLVDLRGDNGRRIGAPTAATHDADHRSGQALSAAVHCTEADGIIFSSRFTGDTCFALFNRSLEKIRYLGIERLVNHPDILAALERYRIQLEPNE